jgi:hypothetical protein
MLTVPKLRNSIQEEMFRPPIHRTVATVLDRSLFSKTVRIAAARIADRKNIAKCRTKLEKSRDLLRVDRLTSVREDPDPLFGSKGGKCLLLQPEVKADGENNFPSIVKLTEYDRSYNMECDITRSCQRRGVGYHTV